MWTYPHYRVWGASLVAQTVENLSAIQETRVLSLAQEDPLQKGMATHSSILAWRTPWKEDPGGLQSMGLQRVWRDWATNTFTFHFHRGCILREALLIIQGVHRSLKHSWHTVYMKIAGKNWGWIMRETKSIKWPTKK